MKVSNQFEQSVYIVVLLAKLKSIGDSKLSADRIARSLDVSMSYLQKTLSKLEKHDIIISKKGANGGYSLKVPISQITAKTIFIAMDKVPDFQKIQFPEELMSNQSPELIKNLEKIQNNFISYLERANDIYVDYLNSISLEELIYTPIEKLDENDNLINNYIFLESENKKGNYEKNK